MSWLAQYFLNPAFVLPGAALASLPIIIHLLSRLRYRNIRFAAMEFLLQSDEQNRRRLILEQILLLFLRVAAVILITLLLARLVLDPSRLLMLRGASVHHVVILDDTLSMREVADPDTLFRRGVVALEQMLTESGQIPGAARFTLLLATQPNQPVVADRAIDQSALQDLLPRIRNLSCSYRTAALAPALQSANDILSADSGVAPQVHVLTDLRRTDWAGQPELVSALEALQAISAAVNVVRITEHSSANVAIRDLSTNTVSVATGVPWRFDLTLQNFSDERVTGLRATVLVDGTPLPGNLLIPPLEPSSEQIVSHDMTFATEGRHRVQVRLDNDALPDDNRRFVAVDVSDRRPVLIIDDDGRQLDAGYVAAALAADGALTGLATEVRTSQALTGDSLERYDCIYLLNIRDLPADVTQRLMEYVKSGGGIAWFPDDQANVTWYSETLRSDDPPLFPVALTTVQQTRPDAGEPEFRRPVFASHPIFSVYNSDGSPFADTVRISRWFGVADAADAAEDNPSARVLATLDNGDPVAFEHRIGNGRVLTFLFGAGRRWSNWPVAPAAPGYVVTHLLMHQYLQRRTDSLQSRELTGELQLQWPVSRFGTDVELFLPEEGDDAAAGDTFFRLQATPVSAGSGDSESAADGNAATPAPPDEELFGVALPQADHPGICRVRRFDNEGNSEETWIALNVPPGESDLRVAQPEELTPLTSIGGVRIVDAAAAASLGGTDAGREMRWLLLGLLIAVLVAEQLLSLKVSYHPEGPR